jgi:hypothetical protein
MSNGDHSIYSNFIYKHILGRWESGLLDAGVAATGWRHLRAPCCELDTFFENCQNHTMLIWSFHSFFSTSAPVFQLARLLYELKL